MERGSCLSSIRARAVLIFDKIGRTFWQALLDRHARNDESGNARRNRRGRADRPASRWRRNGAM